VKADLCEQHFVNRSGVVRQTRQNLHRLCSRLSCKLWAIRMPIPEAARQVRKPFLHLQPEDTINIGFFGLSEPPLVGSIRNHNILIMRDIKDAPWAHRTEETPANTRNGQSNSVGPLPLPHCPYPLHYLRSLASAYKQPCHVPFRVVNAPTKK
jgi:hypothetical protein